ncbi:phosphotransferase enzyme family protein [Colletotrichum asianum]
MADQTHAAASLVLDPDDSESYIKEILCLQYSREVVEIVPLRHNNARVYSISLAVAQQAPPSFNARFGVSPLPLHASQVIMRFSDPASMLNEEIRVQNEVAVMSLAREALEHHDTSLVPEVYGWRPFSERVGWTLIEFKQGVPLGDKFPTLDSEKKRDLLRQIAQVFKHFQKYKPPESARTFGGLNFGPDGSLIGGPTPIAGGGPCTTLSDLYQEYFKTQIGFADKCDIVRGWGDSDLRTRLDQFGAKGLKSLVSRVEARPTLVHGDFDGNNVLFDEATNKLTALLDYDFGHIGSQADEYFYSFHSIQGLMIPPFTGDPEEERLRDCLVNGFTQEDVQRKSDRIH